MGARPATPAMPPTHPQADRGRLRLDEDYRRSQKDKISRARKGRMVLHHGGRRLQSHPATQAHGCGTTPSCSPSTNTTSSGRCTSWQTGLIPITIGNFFNGLLEDMSCIEHRVAIVGPVQTLLRAE